VANNNQIYKMSNAGGFKSLNRYYDMLAGNPVFIASSYDSISTATLTTTQLEVTLSSIPATYKHLQVRITARSDRPVAIDSCFIYLNTDSTGGGNYNAHGLIGTGAAASSYYDNGNFLAVGVLPGSSATSGIFGGFVFDLLDYANTNKFKTSRSIGGCDLNGSGQVRLNSGLWRSTAAVNSITFTCNGPGSFIAGTKVALYGIRG
jgi:hypothetical protein